ncbi:MAG: hypothetical protein AMXMBFR84_02770 [Candidatus Hydrogenedentota bacterium]
MHMGRRPMAVSFAKGSQGYDPPVLSGGSLLFRGKASNPGPVRAWCDMPAIG